METLRAKIMYESNRREKERAGRIMARFAPSLGSEEFKNSWKRPIVVRVRDGMPPTILCVGFAQAELGPGIRPGVRPLLLAACRLIERGGTRVVPFPSCDCSFHELFNSFLALAFALKVITLIFNQAVDLGFVVQYLSAKILPQLCLP